MDNAAAQGGLDPDICRQARLSRDRRFDGEFFLAVRSTGIYCRPVCPARPPAKKNVSYFRLASQAAAAGYRPCLRCRPESAPGSPAWQGNSTTVQRALRLIGEGALNGGSLGQLAARLGVGERYLRKLFQRELGVSPQAVALNQRLLFAKKLLAETSLSLTDVAFAAGFGSVRRFNSAVKEQFRLTPGELRGSGKSRQKNAKVQLQLQYRPPYDWDSTLQFFQRHTVAGVEEVDQGSYRRNLLIGDRPAVLTVCHKPLKHALQLEVDMLPPEQLMPLVARVRRMFDLDANPHAISRALEEDAALVKLVSRYPGVRSPGYWSLYESALRAIVGQQVSTAAARGICARLAAASSGPEHRVFPPAQAITALDDSHFPMPGRRRQALRTLCSAIAGAEEGLDQEQLGQVKGVGPWTLAMVAMRGAGDPDVLPPKDLGLERAWDELGGGNLQTHSARWRPWRSYAANLLWRSLSP